MLQITPQMRILVAIEPADFRRGIDGLARLCKDVLQQDPFAGWVFVFRNRRATAVKVLGQTMSDRHTLSNHPAKIGYGGVRRVARGRSRGAPGVAIERREGANRETRARRRRGGADGLGP